LLLVRNLFNSSEIFVFFSTKMATVTASSNIVSRISHVYHVNVPTISCESKTAPMKLGSMRKANTHNGLRILNSLDELLNRTPIKMKAVKSRRKGLQRKNVMPKGIITCGMNLIFVGTEVGPWSKTGGLGDVLGGLPPVLAVSLLLWFAFYIFI